MECSPTAISISGSSQSSLLDAVFTKFVTEHYHLQVNMINECLCSLVKTKLWWMNQAQSRCNSQQKERTLKGLKKSPWKLNLHFVRKYLSFLKKLHMSKQKKGD